jgi:hypothetical protein
MTVDRLRQRIRGDALTDQRLILPVEMTRRRTA